MAENLSTPSWMTEHSGSCRCVPLGHFRRQSAAQRTLMGISQAMRDSVFSERLAARPGLLQKTDPRVKTAGLLGLLVVAAFLRNWPALLALYVLTLGLAAASRISIRFFIKRVWLFIPVFAGIVALPSIFSVFREGDPLWTIWDFGREISIGSWSLGASLAITYQGVKGAIVLILRVAASVSLAVLLALTTRWSDLLKALRVFLVPRIFVLILSLTNRYIFLFLSLAEDMFTARTSRMVGPSSPREERRFVAGSMGALLGKSQTLSEEVHCAMLSRGFTGEPRTLKRFHITATDLIFAAFIVAVATAALGGDRILG